MSQSDFETKCAKAHFVLEDFQRILTQYQWLVSEEVLEANATAILALERQIPQKPNRRFADIGEGSELMRWEQESCPTCNNNFIIHLQKYCPYCGQRLNWNTNEGSGNEKD